MDKANLFDRVAAIYDQLLPSVFYQAVHHRMLEYVQLPEAANVLEIGCGTGKLLNRMAKTWPDLSGVGLDFSREMVAIAARKTPSGHRLRFVYGDVQHQPFEASTFDAVMCSISFLHYPDPVQVLQEVGRVLKLHGQFYLADFSPSPWASGEATQSQRLPGDIRFYTAAARQELGAQAGLTCDRHDYLLGPVMLSQFTRR